MLDHPPSPLSANVAANLAAIRHRIAAATVRAGRAPDAVRLVAVSKFHPAASVVAALAAGQTAFGENRVQEAAHKFPPLRSAHSAMRLHIIGSLQTNKAADAVRIADTIESLDRPRLADAIADAIARDGRTPSLLIQINTGEEPQKSGIARAEADPAPHFAWLADCAARHGLTELSMGMSADFETAIAYGATSVRVGAAIFGHRPA